MVTHTLTLTLQKPYPRVCWKTYVRDMHVTSSHDASYASSIVLHTDDAVYRLDYYHYHI